MSNKQDAILGVVFFTAVGLLLAVTLLLTNFSLGPRPRLEVRFANAGGLEKGDAVFVLGRRAGEVAEVRPFAGGPDERIVVTMLLDEPIELRSDAQIQIVDASLLGGKRIEIDPGVASTAMPASAQLRGTLRKSAIDALGDEMSGEDSLVGGLKQAVGKLNRGEGTLAQLFNSPRLHDALLAAVESLAASLEAIRQGRGVVGRLVHDESLGEDVAAAVRSVRSVAEKADAGEGPLGVILSDRVAAGQVRGFIADLATIARDLREGEGTAGLLLRDPETRGQVRGIVADVAALVADARRPDSGLLGALFSDQQLLADGRASLATLREFLERATHGKGLVARLVSDEDWARKVGQILGQVQRAIEDAREAAPVGTFFQVITAFF